MNKFFHIRKDRIVTDIVQFTKEQFIEVMNSEKPSEIVHSAWNNITPFIIITEYNEYGIKFFCNGNADKRPEQTTLGQLYEFLRYQGLEDCYIKDLVVSN